MGTYLHVQASDAALEQITKTPAGTAAAVRALYAEYSKTIMQDDHDVWVAGDEAYTAGLTALGDGAADLATLVTDGLGRLMASKELEAAGHEYVYGDLDFANPDQAALAIDVLRVQRRRWACRRGVRLGGTRSEWAASATHYRRLCDSLIAAARAGSLTSLDWS